jgi:hypothetical protein
MGGVMEIASIFGNEYEDEYCSKLGSFTCQENGVKWNGREIKTLTSNANLNISKAIKIRPMMSRPQIDAELSAGYNEEDGGYIEAKISASWKDPPTSSSSSASKSNNEPPSDNESSSNSKSTNK